MKFKKEIFIGEGVYRVSSDDLYLDGMRPVFEPHMVQLFQSLISQEDIVADVGANIGLTALLFQGLAAHVYAFEPSPTTYAILEENLRENKVKNVEAFNIGLGQNSETQSLTFASNNRSGGSVGNQFQVSSGHTTEQIVIDTLDRFFSEGRKVPSFLKIDVEGFEQKVISGGGG